MPDPRTTSPAGINLIKSFEGLRLKSYQDEAGIWTIGYGHTRSARAGQTINESDAEFLLMADLDWAEEAVRQNVQPAINQNQFDALVSFTFNCGGGALRQSSVLRCLNAGAVALAADAFRKWNKITVDGKLVESEGLSNRREAERTLFLTPEGPVAA